MLAATNLNHRRDIVVKIIQEVGSRKNIPEAELPPISDVIEPEALNRLFADAEGELQLTFQYAGFEITVDETQTIELTEI